MEKMHLDIKQWDNMFKGILSDMEYKGQEQMSYLSTPQLAISLIKKLQHERSILLSLQGKDRSRIIELESQIKVCAKREEDANKVVRVQEITLCVSYLYLCIQVHELRAEVRSLKTSNQLLESTIAYLNQRNSTLTKLGDEINKVSNVCV